MPLNPRRVLKEPLLPQLVMGRNEQCWCKSRLKWKNCHYNRHLMPTASYYAAREEGKRLARAGRCLHPKAPSGCSGTPIRSHTIQRGGALSAIAEDGHVMSGGLPAAERFDRAGRLELQRTGINLASTFPGFCNKHDSELFLPIETGLLPLNNQTALLLSYRAMAYELHAKEQGLAYVQLTKQSDKGRPFSEQVRIQQEIADFCQGMMWGIEDLRLWKRDLDQAYFCPLTPNRPGLTAIAFDGILPFVAAFATQPEWDFEGNRIQDPRLDHQQQVSLTVTVSGTRSVVIFSWPSSGSVGKRLAESFLGLPMGKHATALLRYCIGTSENVHFRPSWLGALDEAAREDIRSLMMVGMPINPSEPHLMGADAGSVRLDGFTSERLS